MTAEDAKALGMKDGKAQRASEKSARTDRGLDAHIRTWVELEWCKITAHQPDALRLWDEYRAGYVAGYRA